MKKIVLALCITCLLFTFINGFTPEDGAYFGELWCNNLFRSFANLDISFSSFKNFSPAFASLSSSTSVTSFLRSIFLVLKSVAFVGVDFVQLIVDIIKLIFNNVYAFFVPYSLL